MSHNGPLVGTEHKGPPGKPIQLSDAAESRVRELAGRYPNKKSAVMPALYIAQEELGWLTSDAITWVANRLELSLAHVYEVASFYTMYYKRPVGKYHVQVCRTLSCALRGAKGLTSCLHKKLGVHPGEITPDGMFSYEEVECLGSCGSAPMVEINDIFFENLTPEDLEKLLDRCAREQPNLRYSNVKEELGPGFSDLPKSEVWTKR